MLHHSILKHKACEFCSIFKNIIFTRLLGFPLFQERFIIMHSFPSYQGIIFIWTRTYREVFKIFITSTTWSVYSEAVTCRCSVKKLFLKISQNFQEKMWWSLFFDKVAGIHPTTLLKKRLQHKRFLLILRHFQEQPSYLRWLFLSIFCWMGFIACFSLQPIINVIN